MRFGHTILYVPDVRAALAFYGKAFGLSTRFLHESGDWGELDTGSTSLAFCSHGLLTQMGKTVAAPDAGRPCFEVALVTDDVAEAYAQALEQGAQSLQAPQDMPWGQTVAYVQDLNGFWVELCSPMG
jgi:uncharacterized glyoxalase superfamily protein PhnB